MKISIERNTVNTFHLYIGDTVLHVVEDGPITVQRMQKGVVLQIQTNEETEPTA